MSGKLIEAVFHHTTHHAPRSANSDITNNIYVHIEFEVDGDEERKKTITQGTACE